jgi:hypothetical protein
MARIGSSHDAKTAQLWRQMGTKVLTVARIHIQGRVWGLLGILGIQEKVLEEGEKGERSKVDC